MPSEDVEPALSRWDDPLFEIAIYRVSEERWQEEVEEVNAAARARYLVAYGSGLAPWSIDEEVRRRRRTLGLDIPWEYNQAIAWVRLIWDGPVVKGYVFSIEQQRFTRQFRATNSSPYLGAVPIDKVVECWFFDEATSEEIAEELRRELLSLTVKGGLFARRHVDLAAFDSLAPHLDWRALVGLDR
jgi:hypothetical protein